MVGEDKQIANKKKEIPCVFDANYGGLLSQRRVMDLNSIALTQKQKDRVMDLNSITP